MLRLIASKTCMQLQGDLCNYIIFLVDPASPQGKIDPLFCFSVARHKLSCHYCKGKCVCGGGGAQWATMMMLVKMALGWFCAFNAFMYPRKLVWNMSYLFYFVICGRNQL